jgi:hypothetical protein
VKLTSLQPKHITVKLTHIAADARNVLCCSAPIIPGISAKDLHLHIEVFGK